MNCTDCRELFVAHAEGALDGAQADEYRRHLAGCPACAAEAAAFKELEGQLVSRGEVAAHASVVAPVMRRVAVSPATAPRRSLAPLVRWLVGAGCAAAVALGVVALVTTSSQGRAQAVDVLNRGLTAMAQTRNVHLEAKMRTPPGDNFSRLEASAEFCPIGLWKEFDGQKRWRVEKPGRVAAMNGASTMLLIRPRGPAVKGDIAAPAAFDTGWLQAVANIEQLLTDALKMARTEGWVVDLARSSDANGQALALVTIDTPAKLPPGDYLENKFIRTAATRQVFSFADDTGQLTGLKMYLKQDGDYRLIFELTKIEYNTLIDDALFTLEPPAGVAWDPLPVRGMSRQIANNEKYAAMTPEQAARGFFEACGRQDWTEASAYWPNSLPEKAKQALGGLTIVSIGDAFSSAGSTAKFVPYEVRLINGKALKHNLALKRPAEANRWIVDGGL